MITFTSPLKIEIYYSKKRNKPYYFMLNLNTYRNTCYRILNIAKQNYKDMLLPQFNKIKKKLNRIAVIYEAHKGEKRNYDIGNICSIHQKFFEDALVESGLLPDDNTNYIPFVLYIGGDIDRQNPRVDIKLYDLDSEKDYGMLIDYLHMRCE